MCIQNYHKWQHLVWKVWMEPMMLQQQDQWCCSNRMVIGSIHCPANATGDGVVIPSLHGWGSVQMLEAISNGMQWMLTVLGLGDLWIFIWVRMFHLVADGVGHAAKSSVVMQ